ncbi:putative hydrolase of the HAD superfamily [Mucilaginibacter yixingensis]|uniref:Putative hydrolase of the HAD superfamily n=1 Tax=Mucilaginibacter yixingensis TaxID=1295612 RepID=A0A2T5JGS4_9SPHI|nr:HAD family hydrolase [Mucilaginibacter yixingensis]PTR01594.1 putative hydrolase of the HAD superfamily [Mucilaginibacter yixingensis]
MKYNKVVVFDLDDTLYNEVDYLKSAYYEIAQYVDANEFGLSDEMFQNYTNGSNVFKLLIGKYPAFAMDDLLYKYRNHLPSILPREGALELLLKLKQEKTILGLITDGRSVSQRNKLNALNITHFFDDIIISEEFGSEKPCIANYMFFEKYSADEYYYIADNVKKDFIGPNNLKWSTICIMDNGKHIHKQQFNLEQVFLPKHQITKLSDAYNIIK